MKRREFLGSALGAATVLMLGRAAAEEKNRPPPDTGTPADFSDRAVHLFLKEGKSCAETILMAGVEALGLQDSMIPASALGLAGGIGLLGKTCGCVTGAAMVLSLDATAKEKDYAARKKRLLKAVGHCAKSFEKEFGSTDCRALCGLDLTTPEGFKTLQEDVKARVCSKFVKRTCQMLAETLPTV